MAFVACQLLKPASQWLWGFLFGRWGGTGGIRITSQSLRTPPVPDGSGSIRPLVMCCALADGKGDLSSDTGCATRVLHTLLTGGATYRDAIETGGQLRQILLGRFDPRPASGSPAADVSARELQHGPAGTAPTIRLCRCCRFARLGDTAATVGRSGVSARSLPANPVVRHLPRWLHS